MKKAQNTLTKLSRQFRVNIRLWAILILLIPLLPQPTKAQSTAIYNAFNAGSSGGVIGFRMRRIGASSPSVSVNSLYHYYPASSIKIMEHLFSMVLVQYNIWNFSSTRIPICRSNGNCNDNTYTNLNCNQALATTLTSMMVNSSNNATNAIQEAVGKRFYPSTPTPALMGRYRMNIWGNSALNLTYGGLHSKLGCGGACSSSPNRMHLRDMEKIYQKMAGNSLLAPTYRVIAKNLMLNESTGYFDGIIDQEAASLNRTAFASSFKNRVYMAYKGGSYSCQGDAFRSNSGMLQLPTYGGAYKRIYTYGIFLDRTISSAYTSGTITSATRELLRPAIRAALLTWNNGNSSSAVINLEKDVQAITSLSTKSMGSQKGINAINSAKAELETATPNYLLVANNLYNAVNQLKAQKGNHSNAETLNDLVKHAIEITKDLQAYVVSTGDGEGLGELSKNLDSEITSAQTKVAKGDYLGAMENCLNAAKIGNDRIDWSLQNIAYEDETLGFGSEKAVSELAIVPTKLLQVEAWPNPANSELSLKIELENPSDIHVEIMDLQGRLLAKQFVAKADNRQGETIRFQVQDFPAGTVMVKVVTNDNVITKKVTILH